MAGVSYFDPLPIISGQRLTGVNKFDIDTVSSTFNTGDLMFLLLPDGWCDAVGNGARIKINAGFKVIPNTHVEVTFYLYVDGEAVGPFSWFQQGAGVLGIECDLALVNDTLFLSVGSDTVEFSGFTPNAFLPLQFIYETDGFAATVQQNYLIATVQMGEI